MPRGTGKLACNLAVNIAGYGFHGPVEWQGRRSEFTPNSPPACDSSIGCVLTSINDLRFNPAWGTSWGENGFATINGYETTGTAS